MTGKFSQDPKVEALSLKEFFCQEQYFKHFSKENIWTGNEKPSEPGHYLKITGNLFIDVHYYMSFSIFSGDYIAKLERIDVAYRDGATEYELLNEKLSKLDKSDPTKHPSYKDQAKNIKKVLKLIPIFEENIKARETKKFDDYLEDAGYKSKSIIDGKKYLVFDVETNGVRKVSDDLLSLSIYDPCRGICYNRFFPLHQQPLVTTTFINGITDDTLKGATDLSQNELDQIIEFFDLKHSILLSFSGGQGTFDRDFVVNYCKRVGIAGFEGLTFQNIKSSFPKVPFGCEGQLSKDNLCNFFGIKGVTGIHSGKNDCVLEWKLFEQLKKPILFLGNSLFRFTKDYIVPVTALQRQPLLAEYAGIDVPYVVGEASLVFSYKFPDGVIKKIKKFSTNITGVTIEHALDAQLNATYEDNLQFLRSNKQHLEYVGTFKSKLDLISYTPNDDGTISTEDVAHKDDVEKINETTKAIIGCLSPTLTFIKETVFKGSLIKSQEMVVANDRKVLALCDLSSSKTVLEIKTNNVLKQNDDDNKFLLDPYSLQLWYESNGREAYILSMTFQTHLKRVSWFEEAIDGLTINIYKVALKTMEKPVESNQVPFLYDTEEKVLRALEENPRLTIKELMKKTHHCSSSVQLALDFLKKDGFVKKDNPHKWTTPWTILKTADQYKKEIEAKKHFD